MEEKEYCKESSTINMVTVGQKNTNGEETILKKFDRDPKTGRFIEGNLAAFKHGMRARKFKKIWCNNCYIGKRCKFFEENAICIKERILIQNIRRET